MLILGIESSCDETAASVVKDCTELQSSVIASQALEHQKYGGVVPELASRRHCENILSTVQQALDEANVTVEDLDDATINKVMSVNFFGPVHLIRFFMEDLTKDKTEQYIVNVSSMGGFFPFPGQTIYGASKAALKIFTEGLYAELEKTNVRVMIVLPGAMDTNITKNSNVEIKTTKEESNFKMLGADVAAMEIINGIEKNKFKLFLGTDAKFLRTLYKINSKWAISYINKKMKNNM